MTTKIVFSKQGKELSRTNEALTADDYQTALDVQSGCNLSGIIHSFSRIISKVWEEAKENHKGTDWVNEHPICRLFAEQISHLTRNRNYNEAHDFCQEHANV